MTTTHSLAIAVDQQLIDREARSTADTLRQRTAALSHRLPALLRRAHTAPSREAQPLSRYYRDAADRVHASVPVTSLPR